MSGIELGLGLGLGVGFRLTVGKLYLIDQDQDEAARSAGEGSLDRTTQATGQHYRDGFYDQDEAARSARGRKKQKVSNRSLGLGSVPEPHGLPTEW